MRDSAKTANVDTPHLKRHGSTGKIPQAKRFRRKSPAATKSPVDSSSSSLSAMQWEESVAKLDPNNPVHANRIQQRCKMIQKGKNTAGYDCYVQQVPKQKRVPRSMITPSTPDPTLDIPTKRWQGQVRAWRVALHKYDPPELLNASSASATESADYQTPCKATNTTTTPNKNEDSPISILSESSRRDLNEEFEASLARPTLITGASGWGDDSSDDDDDDLL